MKLTDEENLAFMNDPRRVAAQKELDSIVRHNYMTVLPPLLKKLSDAYENLSVVEAAVMAEVTGK